MNAAAQDPDGPLAQMFAIAKARVGDPQLASMERGEIAATAIGLAETLESIEKGHTKATSTERAFFTGALAALRGVLMAEQSV